MKLKRTLIAGTTAIITVFTMSAMSVSTIAGTHTVSTGTELKDKFNNDSESVVIINLSGNIEDLKELELQAGAGQKYTINGIDYVIKSFVIISGGGDFGENKGEVTINSNIESETDGLEAKDAVNVTVNGNVTSEQYGVKTYDQSKVTVTKDVESGINGATAYDESEITVGGNIDAEHNGVVAKGNSKATVKGNVNADGDGVVAYDESEITVEGNVEAGVTGVVARGESEVTVIRDVSGRDGNSEVDYTNPEDHSDGALGISAYDLSNVTVGGNVSGGGGHGTKARGGIGVYAAASANVEVTGNVTGGSVKANPDTEADPNEVSRGGKGVEMEASAKVTVHGDVSGGSTEGDKGIGGAGAYITLVPYEVADDEEIPAKGKLYVKGTISGGESTAKSGTSGAGVEYIADGDLVPVVTTWKVQSGGEDVSPVVANISEVVAEALNDQHNYIVRIKTSENGMVEIDNPTYNPGETMIITPTPNDGYEVSSVMVNGEEITPVDGVYSYVMYEYGGIEISAEFTAIEQEETTDNEDTDDTNKNNTEKVDSNNDVDLAKAMPKEADTAKSMAPDTGDDSKTTVWSVMTLIATGGLVSVIAAVKKRRNNK